MTRLGVDARDWALNQVNHPTQNWYRLCQMFVRMSFDRPGGVPDAGSAWDWSKHKHRTSDPESIPAFVPVYWELPSVADHVAFTLGDGWCLSNDILRSGRIDKVRIHTITTRWGGQLLGWTEDCNGALVYKPKPPDPETPNITAYFRAEDHEAKLAALQRVVKHGDKEAKTLATRLIALHQGRQDTTERIGRLRKELRRQEVRG